MENNTDNCDVHGSVVMHLTLHSRLQSGHQKYIPSAQLNYQAQNIGKRQDHQFLYEIAKWQNTLMP